MGRTKAITKKKQKVNDQEFGKGTFQTLAIPQSLLVERDQSCLEKRKFEEMDEVSDIVDDAVSDEERISVTLIASDDVKELTSYFRKLLSGENPPITQVIDCGVVPCLVRFLQMDDSPDIQLEAAGAITRITLSNTLDHIRYMIDAGVVPILIRLLSSKNEGVRSEAAWALGNIAGNEDVKFRDIALAGGALPALIQAVEDCDEQSSVLFVRAISRLSGGVPAPDLLALEPALPLLSCLLSSEDVETVAEACLALNNISAGGDDGIQTIIEAGVVSQLIELLRSTSPKILSPAIKTIANITKGDNNTSQIQLIMSYDILPRLLELLDHVDEDIRRDVCDVISNITNAGDQIQAVIDAGIFPKLIKLMKSSDVEIQNEAIWAVYNATFDGNPSQIWYLIGVGVIPALCSLLQVNNDDLVRVVLGGLESMVHATVNQSFDKLELFVKEVCDCDGMMSHFISDDIEKALSAIQYFNKILRISKKNPPIQQVIDCGVVPCLIRFLQMDDRPDIQLEAAGAITSITLSNTLDHIRYMIDAGVVPILIRLLSSKNEGVRSEAAWALGNIAGNEDVQYRDIVLAGVLPALIQAAEKGVNEMIVYAISKLCCVKPSNFEVIRATLPLLRRLLDSQNEEIVKYSCISFSHIAERMSHFISAILDVRLNIIPRLIELLVGSTSPSILKEAITVLGNIACGGNRQTQSVLVALPSLLWLLDHPDLEIRKQVCWALSNITAGTTEQKQAVIDAAIFPKLFELLKSEDAELKKRVVRAVWCATRGSPEQVWYLMNEGVIPLLCKQLLGQDADIVSTALAGLKNMLYVSKTTRKLQQMVSLLLECDGIESIKQLQKDKRWEISSQSKEIIQTLFP